MASTTPNIGLTLPVGTERVSRQTINENNTKIDQKIGPVGDTDLQTQINSLNSNKAEINTAYSFDGTPDDNGFIVTNLPLSSNFYPIAAIRPSRQGWVYFFTRYNNLSSTYWCVCVRNATPGSGNFSGTIVAVGNE